MALDKTGQAAPGKDEISYVTIKHLSKRGLVKWLMLYNKVWKEGKMPKSWKGVVNKPIRKPGKDVSKPGSNQPIVLTSHICKLMERMINERLIYSI